MTPEQQQAIAAARKRMVEATPPAAPSQAVGSPITIDVGGGRTVEFPDAATAQAYMQRQQPPAGRQAQAMTPDQQQTIAAAHQRMTSPTLPRSVEQLRQQFPQYAELSDGDLLMGAHRAQYSHMHPRAFLNAIEGAANAHVTIRNPELREHWRSNVTRPMDGESEDEIQRRLGGTMEGPVGNPGGPVMAGVRSGLQGLTFGFGDEIVARGASALSGNTYEQELQAERDRLNLGREQHPVASYGSEIAGAVATPGAAIKALKSPNFATRTLASGTTAAGAGAVYGFGAGEGGLENRLDNAQTTGAVSGVIGAGAPAVGVLGKLLADRVKRSQAGRAMVRNAPSLDQLRSRAQSLFDRADAAPAMDRSTLTDAASGIASRAERLGLDEGLTPQSSQALNRIMDAATDPNPQIGFREMDILRRQASIPAGNRASPVESAIGSGMVGSIDDVIESAAPQVGSDVAEARALWGSMRRSELIDEAFNRAQNHASGFENGLRSQFRSILNNPQKRRGLSADEIAAMERVVRGSVGTNVLNKLGKLGVGLNQQSNALMASLGATGGYALGGPLGALAAPTIGTIAQKLGQRGTRRAADFARALSASGGQVPRPQISAMQRLMLEDLVRRGAHTAEAVR